MTIYDIMGLIIVAVQVIFIPWAVYVTRSINNHDKEIAIAKEVTKSKDENISKMEVELKEKLRELTKKIDDMPREIVDLIRNLK